MEDKVWCSWRERRARGVTPRGALCLAQHGARRLQRADTRWNNALLHAAEGSPWVCELTGADRPVSCVCLKGNPGAKNHPWEIQAGKASEPG